MPLLSRQERIFISQEHNEGGRKEGEKKKKKKIEKKKANQGGISCGLGCCRSAGPRGGCGETYWAVWETHSLSFSHIVLQPGSPQPPAKAVNATKDTLPIVPGTAERIELALHSFPASLSRWRGEEGTEQSKWRV